VAADPAVSAERVSISDLKPHPRNYRNHPEDQLAHLEHSLKEHGLYRNVVVAKDGTILAGHGVVEAARRLGWEEIEVRRLDVDPEDSRALKVLTGDNELARLAEIDDRLLAEHLKALAAADELLGTGFDEQMLANLAFVTRLESEMRTMDEAAAWAGMPSIDPIGQRISLVIAFDSETDRAKLVEELGLTIAKKTRGVLSAWWPPRSREDLSSLRWETDGSG
jgi:hypothetical protein